MTRKFTPSQQLRAALFVYYYAQPRTEDFETFYKDQIGRAIDRVHKVLERRGAMQVKVDSVSDVKTNAQGTSSKMTCGGVNYFVQENATPHIGKMLEITAEEKTSKAGNKYNVAKIIKVIGEGGGASGGNGAIPWKDYEIMAKLAHSFALGLEPDSNIEGALPLDRSQARAAILNTIMIAYSNGKIYLPDEEIPF
jgi:hypothetical protein